MNLTDFASTQSNGTSNGTGSTPPAGNGFLGGMDIGTISALVVLASAFMRR